MTPEQWALIDAVLARAEQLDAGEAEALVRGELGTDVEALESALAALAEPGKGSRFLRPPSVDQIIGPGDEQSLAGKSLGEFHILDRISEGGMGIVYRARQASLARDVAVKVLYPAIASRALAGDKFEREARAAARLDHPGIVRILTSGKDRGIAFIAMELVGGPSLASEIGRMSRGEANERLPAFSSADYMRSVAEVVSQAADALAFAHAAGVIHRDIKADNLLLDGQGRTRMVDFGLARDEAQGRFTREGERAGTLPYMSPEQLGGEPGTVGPRTDVYSLGIVLFELLTLRKPFVARSDILPSKIVAGGSPPASNLNERVPHDLDLICASAMATSVDDRYPTAAMFRDDLQRFLRGEAVLAKRPSFRRRSVRWAHLHAGALTVTAVATTGLAFGLWIESYQSRRQNFEDQRTRFQRVLAQKDWSDLGELVDARKRLKALRDSGVGLPTELDQVATQLERRFKDDRDDRVRLGQRTLEMGLAGRADPSAFGDYKSPPSERDLAEAMRIFSDARVLYWEDSAVQRLAGIQVTFPRITVELAPDTLANAPGISEARVFARPIDTLRCSVGPAMDLGPVPIREQSVPPGYWRFEVVVPGYGAAELTRYLVQSASAYKLVARVLPAPSTLGSMQRIEGGKFTFRKDSPLGCCSVGDSAAFDTFWIDEAELSNGEFVEFLASSKAPPPSRWVELGYRGNWRSLPLGSDPERWLSLPIVGINVYEATACAEWFGKRLPTHVELERALRGSSSNFLPWDNGGRREDAGRFNVDGPDAAQPHGVAESFANYLAWALPVRESGYRQQPSGLFHAFGNVAEWTESFKVEPQGGMLMPDPWTRIYLGGAWDSLATRQSLASHPFEGAEDAYTRNYIGLRCAKSAAGARLK